MYVFDIQCLQVQLNDYGTDPYFLQIFISNTSVCLSCKPICEPEITLVHLENQSKNNFTVSSKILQSAK